MDGDGCDSACTTESFYECTGTPSVCTQPIKWVSIREFNVTNVSPEAIHYDPQTRSFVGYKKSAGKDPIELCLDGTLLDPNSNCVKAPGSDTCVDGDPVLVGRDRPVGGNLEGGKRQALRSASIATRMRDRRYGFRMTSRLSTARYKNAAMASRSQLLGKAGGRRPVAHKAIQSTNRQGSNNHNGP